MTYELVYTRRAARDAAALDGVTRRRIGKKILELKFDPVAKSKKLSDSRLGTYRYRVGDYRVVFDVSGPQVIVLRIGHRREIYR